MQPNPALLEQRYVPMSIKQRANGLNKTAEIKAKIFKSDDKELKIFIENMRNRFNGDIESNKKFLGMVFYYADINKNRHDCNFDEFTQSEIKQIIKAINEIKGGVAFFPKNLPSPLN